MKFKVKVTKVKDDFPDGFYTELGKLTVEFGRLDYEMALCIKSLHAQGFEEGMEEALKTGTFGPICKRARELAEKKLPEPHLTRFHELTEQGFALAEGRNDTVHAHWRSSENKGAIRHRLFWNRQTKELDSRNGAIEVSTLTELVARARTLWRALNHERLREWPEVLGGKRVVVLDSDIASSTGIRVLVNAPEHKT